MKTIYLSFFLLGCAYVSHAQGFGLKGGAQLNNIRYNNFENHLKFDEGPNIGFHLGAFIQLDISERFAIIPELQFINRGFVMNNNEFGDGRANANYLELPVLASFSPLKILRIEAGPTFAYKVRSNSTIHAKSTEIGTTGGIRVTPTEKIAVLLHYHTGLTHFLKIDMRDENNNDLGSGTIYNTGIQLSLAYKFK